MAKEIIFKEEARKRMKRGIDTVANAVRATIGPRGRNAIIDRGYGAPTITNDGVSIAKEISLEDKMENLGASVIKEVANKTNDSAGDGTSTATVLTHAIIHEGMKVVTMGANPMNLKTGIQKASELVRKELSNMAKKISSDEEIARVASVSAESEEIGKIIAETIKKVGKDGVITVEESQTIGIESEVVEGLQFSRGYVSPYMITNPEKMKAELRNPMILVTDHKISSMKDVLPVMEELARSGKKDFVVIADDIEGEALASFILNKLRGAMNILAIKAPGFGDSKKQELIDIATVTGATFIDSGLDMKLEDVTMADLGSADKVVSSKDETIIIGGKGDEKRIREYIEYLKKQLENVESKWDREKLEKRIAKLSGGVAVIKVGAATESEMKYLKDKIEDAVNATKAALEEGIIPGGGSALVKIAQKLSQKTMKNFMDEERAGFDLVLRALEAPLRQIAINAGKDDGVVLAKVQEGGELAGYDAKKDRFVGDMIKEGIIDPVKVTKSAVLNSASAASVFLTTEVAIADLPEKHDHHAHAHGADMGGAPMMM